MNIQKINIAAIAIFSVMVIVLFITAQLAVSSLSKQEKQNIKNNFTIDSLKTALAKEKKNKPYIEHYSKGMVVETGVCGEYTIEWGQPTCGFYSLGNTENQITLRIDGVYWHPQVGDITYIMVEKLSK